MFSHVMIGTNDLDRARTFYDAVLGTLGVPAGFLDRYRVFWRTPTGTFSVSTPIDGKPATAGNGLARRGRRQRRHELRGSSRRTRRRRRKALPGLPARPGRQQDLRPVSDAARLSVPARGGPADAV
jgi:catechol 2,3-dioxygenase-like lactoylglutathione lyase family enzyme